MTKLIGTGRLIAIVAAISLVGVLASGCSGELRVTAGNLREATAVVVPTQPFVVGALLFGTATPGGGGSSSVIQVTAPPRPTSTRMPTTAPTVVASGGGGAASVGNAANGRVVFTGIGTCSSCHDIQSGMVMTGPSLVGVASRAQNRVAGMGAEAYLRQSILQPNAFVVEGFVRGIMPVTFGNSLNPTQINDLIAFLLTLK